MGVAADRAFLLTSKMKVMSALFVAEPLRSSCFTTQRRTQKESEALSETNFAGTNSKLVAQ
jgi:hypothetical protein